MMNRLIKEQILNQKARVVFITGRPSSGKTTVANALAELLSEAGFFTKILDGDEVRSGLNSDLRFSIAERAENIRRVAEVAKMFVGAGVITIVCLVSPSDELRSIARRIIGTDDFIEVFMDCSLEECERRDVKGMYKQSRQGAIKDFTGVQQLFEAPASPDIVLDTEVQFVEESAKALYSFVLPRVILVR